MDFAGSIGQRQDCKKKERERNRGLTYVSARTMRVRLAFSIVNFVLPSCPAIRPGGVVKIRNR